METDAATQERMQRIGSIVEQLESAADPHVRALARELVESLMAVHGAGLEYILKSIEAGDATVAKLAEDKLVGSLLLLYGLHPENVSTRVHRAVEKMRTFLETHGAKAKVASIGEDGAVTVHLEVGSKGCGSTEAAVRSALESALQDAAPDAPAIHIVGPAGGLRASGFVSLTQLTNNSTLAVTAGERAQGAGG